VPFDLFISFRLFALNVLLLVLLLLLLLLLLPFRVVLLAELLCVPFDEDMLCMSFRLLLLSLLFVEVKSLLDRFNVRWLYSSLYWMIFSRNGLQKYSACSTEFT
jgi:hypothetical protein